MEEEEEAKFGRYYLESEEKQWEKLNWPPKMDENLGMINKKSK